MRDVNAKKKSQSKEVKRYRSDYGGLDTEGGEATVGRGGVWNDEQVLKRKG